MKFIHNIHGGVGRLSEWTGRLVSFLISVMVFSIAYDVFMRYLFSKPTIWSFTLSYMLGGTVIALGAAYVFLHDANVRIDLFYKMLSTRGKRILNIAGAVIFFFPYILVLNYVFWKDALYSVHIREIETVSIWYAPYYPFKLVLSVGLTLLLVQGMVIFLKDVTLLCKRDGDDES